MKNMCFILRLLIALIPIYLIIPFLLYFEIHDSGPTKFKAFIERVGEGLIGFVQWKVPSIFKKE